ncbi:Very-long-chain 3-oxoacyl-CoA reductase [Smittium mucronatum]|uniref:Very-long-chain 3-oxoacyl-CoA reductase n=1 Tax=Smittium mucronatum TaxID=133383 RepID=A0A1R0GZT8_9FUNG|nr:Very-long-chain 3-oxoacyl-CoA reductase [Smittium mucronatum]
MFSRSIANDLFLCAGIFVVAYYVFRIAFMFVDLFLKPGKSLTDYGAGKGDWAVITGATDGIGAALAKVFAQRKLNLFLISRSQEKLETEKTKLEGLGVSVKILPVDFSKATEADWNSIRNALKPLPVSILVNCVGISHEFPKPFEEEDEERCQTIIDLNVMALTKMTRIVIPKMKSRKNGLIINMGSFASLIPSPFLAMYSGSKAFVKSFSTALGAELKPHGILVQHINTAYVVSKMSKVRNPSWTTPMPKDYAVSMVEHLSNGCGSVDPFTSVPFVSHALMNFVIENCLPRIFWLDYNYNMLSGIRKRALNKAAKEKAAAIKSQ